MSDSTMTLSEAQAEAAKWGNLIRALSRLQEAAETIGQLDRNRAERQAQVDQLGEEIQMANEHLTELQRAVTEAEARRLRFWTKPARQRTNCFRELRLRPISF